MSIRPVIIVPIYKEEENEEGKASLYHLSCKIQGKIQIIFAVKESIKDKVMKGTFKVAFPDFYFKDLKTYSQLFNSSMFWEHFSNYTHGLIFQPDCWLYGDHKELEFWCKQGYAMVGSPHFKEYDWEKNPNELIPNSMNGGFSLRDIKAHIELAHHLEATVPNYSSIETHEDVHWCNCFTHFGYRMPDPMTAARFGFEHGAKSLYPAIGNNKPFGCHNPWKFAHHYPEELKDFIL
jgi:hypothetical protein